MNTSLKKEVRNKKGNEEHFKYLYENAPLPYQSLDYDGCLLEVNQAWLDIMGGYAKAEVIGRSFDDFLLPESKENFKYNFPRFKDKGEVLGVEFNLIKKDDSVVLVQLNGKIGYDADGNFAQTHCIFHDITQQRANEKKLQKKDKQWERTFNAVTDIVILMDPNLNIVKINSTGLEILRVPLDVATKKHCHELFHNSATPCPSCPLAETKANFQPYSTEIYHEKLGKTFLVSAAPVYDDHGTLEYIAHVAKDISEKKNMEQKLVQSQKMEAIGTLAGGIAHDFNNILSVVIGFSEMAKKQIEEGEDPVPDMDQVIKAGNRAISLVQQILTFSRKVDYCKRPIQPHLLIKETLKMLRSSIPTTIEIIEDIDSTCGFIKADPINIHQIMMNLFTNSTQAIENEKGTISISLKRKKIQPEEIPEADVSPGEFVVLSVIDTGGGMDLDTKKMIFDPYFTTKNPGKGTGLGLAVIYGIIKELKGFIQVESETGEGTSFHVYIPASEAALDNIEENEDVPQLPRGVERILVVDDEAAITNLQQVMLQGLGYRVTAMTDSKEALEKISSNPDQFDLLITDQTMPNITGSELAKEILKIKPEMPIILSTGYSTLITEEMALEIGIKKFAKKPLLRGQLAHIVREVLDNG